MTADAARRHGVVAVLVDGPADLPVARLAARRAADAGTRLLAAVLLAPGDPDADAHTAALRCRREADAVAGRLRPTADAHDVALTVVPLLLPPGAGTWSPYRLRRALRLLVRRSGATALVLPDCPLMGVAPRELERLPGAVVARDSDGRRSVQAAP